MSVLRLYAVFHLNLAYSSIEVAQRSTVVRDCYWPLLRLARKYRLPFGIETSGYTLEAIAAVDPAWVSELKTLLADGNCELIGSGYAQLIGPLVPPAVNRANLLHGSKVYQGLLGVEPEIALVNEQAYSAGLVQHYLDAGYRAVVMEWDNPARCHPEWDRDWRYLPQFARGAGQEAIAVLWNNSIAFQRMQRYAHGDMSLRTYLEHLAKDVADTPRTLSIYGNDVEVFDFRPGRYHTEPTITDEGEWARVEMLFGHIVHDERFEFVKPSEVLELLTVPGAGNLLALESGQEPIPVKKQPKYNVSRWAVTGRNDLWINTLCHRIHRELVALERALDDPAWRRLCEYWASDLRTHITDERWQQAEAGVRALAAELGVNAEVVDEGAASRGLSDEPLSGGGDWFTLAYDKEEPFLSIETDTLRLTLNLRRGLAIQSLAFPSQDFVPMVGTLPHGYFDTIDLGADFYSGGTVVELVTEHRRVTDLERVEPVIGSDGRSLLIRAQVVTRDGPIVKEVVLSAGQEEVGYGVSFPGWTRPYGMVRVGHITFFPEAFEEVPSVECANGGNGRERFRLDNGSVQPQAASTLVSCTTGLGATDGVILLGDGERRLKIAWDPSSCAAFPMIFHRKAMPGALTRVIFSLGELDETARPGGVILPFRFTLAPARAYSN